MPHGGMTTLGVTKTASQRLDRLGAAEGNGAFAIAARTPRLARKFGGKAPALSLFFRQVVVADRPPGGAVEIIELAALERPQECREAEAAQRQRDRHEINEDVHRPCLPA